MKADVYILKSDSGKYYVGSTSFLERRIRQHKNGHTSTTRRMGNLTLVFRQTFDSLSKVRVIERRIKSWKRKDFIEKIISDGLIKIGV